jgi:hypothetical protein
LRCEGFRCPEGARLAEDCAVEDVV